MRLVLASSSPRRAELLRAAGFAFEIAAVDIDERVLDGESPEVYVRRLAAEKSAAAFSSGPPEGGHYEGSDLVVVGADTAVVIDGEILGKPLDDEDGERMLRRLSGRTHEVLTGVSVRRNGTEAGCIELTRVTFAALSDEQIRWYVSSGEGRDKAGGYGIQGL